jgi:hypothetical protein
MLTTFLASHTFIPDLGNLFSKKLRKILTKSPLRGAPAPFRLQRNYECNEGAREIPNETKEQKD